MTQINKYTSKIFYLHKLLVLQKLYIKFFIAVYSVQYTTHDKRVYENITIIGDLSKTIMQRPTYLIGDPSETDRPHRRPRHAWSKTNIPDPRLIGDRHACEVQSEFKHIYLKSLIFI